MPVVLVPPQRWEQWLANFEVRHGGVDLDVSDGALAGSAPDGARFVARLPFDATYAGPPQAAHFAAAATPPEAWGVLLVRRGGFAVARLEGERLAASKVGQRHVQGRTKAGGQSQQRFARRRDNQAREAFAAAAEHAVRILTGPARRPRLVVTGGDRAAVDAVLADERLRGLTVAGRWLPVADPRRAVLDQAVAAARAVRVDVHNG